MVFLLFWQRKRAGQICEVIQSTSSFLLCDFCKVDAVPELSIKALSHAEEHCWWPWPLVGLVGTNGGLAPCGDLLEIHFSVWFPAVGPDKPAQTGAAFKKWLNFCSIWNEVAETIRSPLSVLLCCLHPMGLLIHAPLPGSTCFPTTKLSCGSPLATHREDSAPLLPKESKLLVLFPHC